MAVAQVCSNESSLSKDQLLKIMDIMGYTYRLSETLKQELFTSISSLLSIENSISSVTFFSFLCVIHQIETAKQVKYDTHRSENSCRKDFGSVIEGLYMVEDKLELKMLLQRFQPMIQARSVYLNSKNEATTAKKL